MTAKTKIVLDADVIIHFVKAGQFSYESNDSGTFHRTTSGSDLHYFILRCL